MTGGTFTDQDITGWQVCDTVSGCWKSPARSDIIEQDLFTGRMVIKRINLPLNEERYGNMKMKTVWFLASVLLATAICICCFSATAEEYAEDVYIENEWNYMDQSMDVSHGIPDDAAGVLDRIKRTGVLRIATEPYFAPQEFIDPELEGQGQYVGADMKLAALIAERMGVKLEIIPMDFSKVLPSLAEDQCDLTISAIAYTPGRASAYTLSKGYYFAESTASTAVIIRENDLESIKSLEDLTDKVIAAQSTSLQEAQASRNLPDYAEFRRLSSVQDVYDMIISGKADAGFVDMETAQKYIENNPDAGLALIEGLYFSLEEYELGDRICAKKGEQQLICFVNGVIDEVLADGSYTDWIREAEKRASELGL